MPKLLISDFDIGFENDKEPFLLPEKAFPLLEDVYIWRGRVKKRFGFNLFDHDQLLSRLRLSIGDCKTGVLITVVPGAVPIPSPGRQQFSIGNVILTSNNTTPGLHTLLTTDPLYTGTINNTTGAVNLAFPISLTPIYYYPGLPVMGLRTREDIPVNYEECIAFDPQFSYRRIPGAGWDVFGPLPPAAGSAVWTGTNSDFFWTVNYRATNAYNMNFYVVNGVVADNIRYFTQGGVNWTNLRPQLDVGATRYLETCKILIPFKDRLVALNTIEDESGNDRTYENRARWSQNGDPTIAATSWLDDTIGRGGYIDAPVSEAITSAQFVQNRLIVFFERSSWELVYTGNEILPFIWQQINTELGCESTFSEVNFDKGIVGIGNRGIHIASTNGVERIDVKIPDLHGQINNSNNGAQRVYGIRDFGRELVMWTYPLFGSNQIFPNKVLVFNYRNNTFAEFNDSFTCYGYYQKSSGLTWATLPFNSWLDWNVPWNNGISQAEYPLIITGNQQGWTFLFEETISNDYSLFVTNVTNVTYTITCPDHNLKNNDFILLDNMNDLTFTIDGIVYTNNYVYKITNVTQNTFDLNVPIGSVLTITGVYIGGGEVQKLNKLNFKTKNFALFQDEGKKTNLNDLHLLLTKTSEGEITLNMYQDFNFNEAILPLLGNSSIDTKYDPTDLFMVGQDKIWQEVKRGLLADSFQLEFTLSETQMRNLEIQGSDFELHAILMDVEPTGRLR